MSNFSFSHCVFKRLLPQTRENQGLFGKGLNGFVLSDSKKQFIESNEEEQLHVTGNLPLVPQKVLSLCKIISLSILLFLI